VTSIIYDPACVDCRRDAHRFEAGTTWQCPAHVQRERDRLREELAEARQQTINAANEATDWKIENRKVEAQLAEARRERDAALRLAPAITAAQGEAVSQAWDERDAAIALLREAEYWSTPEIDRGPASPKWVAFRARLDALLGETEAK